MRLTGPAVVAILALTLLASACGVFLYAEIFGSGWSNLFHFPGAASVTSHKQIIFYFPLTSP